MKYFRQFSSLSLLISAPFALATASCAQNAPAPVAKTAPAQAATSGVAALAPDSVAVAQADIPSGITKQSAQVWIGGSRAWPDYIADGAAPQWKFLADNADGFYINNFAMRLTDKTLKLEPTAQARFAALQKMSELLKSDKLFYETDQAHSTDDFEKNALENFKKAGFDVTAVTINRGTNPARTAILTDDGKRPLYYMFGPWRGGGDINNAENADLRANIAQFGGSAVDGPVTMWRKNAGKMKPMVYSTIQWTQKNNQKFLYLLAPNESGAGFLGETQKLAHDMEDNGANPNIWAVSFYGPPTFRDALETLPEALPDGAPAKTFSGAAYWLIHHLRAPGRSLRLSLPKEYAAAGESTPILDLRKSQKFEITVANDSKWLDLTPVARARFEVKLPANVQMKWTIGERDVTKEINGEGLVFNRNLRLQPGQSRQLTLEVEREIGQNKFAPINFQLELLAHPSTPIVKQSLAVSVKAAQ